MMTADGIVFDCDGVLVDVANSYYKTIALTTHNILYSLSIPVSEPKIGPLIQSFKDTGAYNNEIDLTYSIILSMAAGHRAGLDPYEAAMKLSVHNKGIHDTEQRANEIHNIHDMIDDLAYPGCNSVVQEVFDQIFYGPSLYRTIFNRPSKFSEPGLIDTERLYMDDKISDALVRRFHDKIGMVTGRGYKSASYTLGRFMKIFDVRASSFLEDEPRDLAKPNPAPLRSAMQKMKVQNCIYVGDSVEDLIMAKRVDSVTFVGVWGSSIDPSQRERTLQYNGADYTIESLSHLEQLLEEC